MQAPCREPLAILPYYFAVEPAPTDARSAFAVARSIAGEAELAVSVMLEDGAECSEIFRFGRLGFVDIAWSRCGRWLAFAHDTTLMVRGPEGSLRIDSSADNIRSLAYDARQRLWCLAGSRLEARVDDRVTIVVERVECVTVSGLAAYARRDQEGIGLYLHDGIGERRVACLQDFDRHAAVQMSMCGDYLAVVLASATLRDRARVRIFRVELATSGVDLLLDEHVAFGFNAGPGIAARMLGTGEVLAAYEDASCTRLWTLAPGRSPSPVSPDGFEVFDFVVDATGTRLAIVASDTRTCVGASQRQLLVGRREQGRWQFCAPVPGIYDMPRWRHDAGLELLCGDGGRWTRRICPPGVTEPTRDAEWCRTASISEGGVEYDIVELPGERHRKAAVVLLPRLHQQFVAGAQGFFFHQFLFSIARFLAVKGYRVVVLSGPGAIGGGRRRREPPGPYFASLQRAVRHLTQRLHAEGCGAIGMLGGSLAAVPALRMLGHGTPFTACALVAPLFDASIPLTQALRHHLVDDPSIMSLDEAAANMAAPLLVIHGACDEVAPLWQVSRLHKRVPDAAMIELRILEEEGHIFRNARSWQTAQAAIEAFFATHLSRMSVAPS